MRLLVSIFSPKPRASVRHSHAYDTVWSGSVAMVEITVWYLLPLSHIRLPSVAIDNFIIGIVLSLAKILGTKQNVRGVKGYMSPLPSAIVTFVT